MPNRVSLAMYAAKGSASVSAGRNVYESLPQPPIGKTFSHTPKITSSSVPMTNDGRLMPTSATNSVARSAPEPGLIPPMIPAVNPIAQANRIASNPSVIDTGKPAARISLTVQS